MQHLVTSIEELVEYGDLKNSENFHQML